MIGKTISHYKILEKLGGGGMGVVYAAEDTKLKRKVALKFLPPEITCNDEIKKRFIHEAQTASALDHPNICTIHEIDEIKPTTKEPGNGQMFIVMACYEGESLKIKIARGPLKVAETIDIAMQIAEGLAKAHQKGIVHRDIKPANILVTEDGIVKIVDFGLAKLTGRTMLTKEGTTLGTVVYMSPEQARGEKVDHRTDIWSFGVMLYEMVTGQLPFRGEYEQAVVYSILNEDPEPPTALRSGMTMEMERIILKSLAKKPEGRYQHVDEMLVDLKSIRAKTMPKGETIEAKTEVIRTDKPSRKPNPRRRIAIFGILLLLIVTATVYLWVQKTWQPFIHQKVSKKIAILPLINLTGDPSQTYFCDGMTEQLITNLSRVPELKVIARTSVMRYKNTKKDIRQISKELDAPYVLEGSVRKSDKRVRITAQLIEAKEGTHLWANDYDRNLRDIFAIQDDVSQSIAHAL